MVSSCMNYYLYSGFNIIETSIIFYVRGGYTQPSGDSGSFSTFYCVEKVDFY